MNPANEEFVTGGGVDRMICKAAGPDIEQAKRSIGSCPIGSAVATPGFDIQVSHIIHTTAPRFYTLTPYETPKAELLRNCYVNSLELAKSLGLKSIAFPALGTGAYNWPHEESARIAVSTINSWLQNNGLEVSIVLPKEDLVSTYTKTYNSTLGEIRTVKFGSAKG